MNHITAEYMQVKVKPVRIQNVLSWKDFKYVRNLEKWLNL